MHDFFSTVILDILYYLTVSNQREKIRLDTEKYSSKYGGSNYGKSLIRVC